MSIRRRDFLKAAVGTPALLSFAPAIPSLLVRAACAAAESPSDRPTALVVLQLTGGNDGLNTVVPVADDQYGRNRNTLRLTAREVLKIDDHLGFHPAMKGMARLMAEGRLSVIQGVGYEANSRDHDEAMRDWHTARPADAGCDTGWIGRALDAVEGPARIAAPGVFVGPIPKTLAVTARRSVVPHVRTPGEIGTVHRGLSQFSRHTEEYAQWGNGSGRENGTVPFACSGEAQPAPPGENGTGPICAQHPKGRPGKLDLSRFPHPSADPADNPLLEHVRRGAAAARAGSRQVQAVLREAGAVGPYPDFPLAAQLKAVAQLIRAELGIRFFVTELGGGGIGGFDNHANQRDNHASLLAQLSAAVTAFVDDLAHAGLADRVVLMTFSEFGRTLAENGRRGTDHGAAAPVLLAGGRLRGGLIGAHPNLTDLDADSPRPHTDFRRVYATLLDRWLAFDSRPILGRPFEPLELFS